MDKLADQSSWTLLFYSVQSRSSHLSSADYFTSFSLSCYSCLFILRLDWKYLGEETISSYTSTEYSSEQRPNLSCSWKTNNYNYMKAGCMWMQHYFVQANQLNSISEISLNYRRIHVCNPDSRNQF